MPTQNKNRQKGSLSLSQSPLKEKKLKPLIISRSDGGGAGIAARRIHQALRKNGVQSTMLVMTKNSADPSIIQAPTTYAGLTNCSYSDNETTSHQVLEDSQRWQALINKHKNRKPDISFFSDIFSNIELYNIKEVQDAEIINIHWVAGIVNYPDLPFALSGKPVFWTLHDMNPFTGGCHYTNGCKNYLKNCGNCPQLGSNLKDDITYNFFSAKEKALRNLDLNIITPSRWLGHCSQTSSMLSKFPHQVVPNCVPTKIFRPKKRNLIRAYYGLAEKDFVILAGAITLQDERKGFTYIIKALKRLSKNRPSRKITLALYGKIEGNPPLPERVELLNLGYIHDSEEMADIYNLADIFIIPSLEDNLPNTVIEAMACGTPVVGFRTGGIPDMIIPEETGYLVEQRDIVGLVKGIEWAMALNEKMPSIRTYCRKTVLENFSEKVIAEQYSQLFEQALNRKKKALELLNEISLSNKKRAEIFKKVRKLYPFTSELLREEALLFNDKGERDKAIELFSEALDHNPGDHLSLLSYGTLTKDELSTEDFCRKANAYLDRFPDDNTIRAILSRAQQTIWHSLIDSNSKITQGNNTKPPLISIIISLFSSNLSALHKTLNSLTTAIPKQAAEIIIVNFSTDIKSIKNSMVSNGKTHKFKLICLSPVLSKPSTALAVNLGMISGSGRYCINLPAGDQLSDISPLIDKLERSPHIAAAYGNTLLTSADKKIGWPYLQKLGDFTLLTLTPTTFNYLKHHYSVGPHPVWRRNLYNEFGFWDTRPENLADQDFWLRVCRKKQLAYLPTITGKATINEEQTHNIPDNLKQSPILTRRYRSVAADTPTAQARRLDDIDKYVNHNYQGLTCFIKDLGDFIKQSNYIEALDLYDRIRWDMLPTPELNQIDTTLLKIRLATFSKSTTFANNEKAATLPKQLDQDFPNQLETTLGDQFFKNIYQQILPHTMLSEQHLYSLYKNAKTICDQDIPGNFIECGVATGGSSALLAATIKKYSKRIRRIFAFDSFSGMPKPGKYDTTSGVNAEDTSWGTGTCAAPEESIKLICRQLNINDLVVTVKGYFAETLPLNLDRVGMIAFLHLDGDWYDSTMIILETFYKRVVAGGILQIDDYGHWTGCHKAVHEFADKHELSFEINDIDGTGVWIPQKRGFHLNSALPEDIVTNFNEIEQLSLGVTSQMSQNERFQLYYTINQMISSGANTPINFIEIGSFSGASLTLFYFALKQKKIKFSGYSVEPYGTKQFKKIIPQLQPEIVHLQKFSDQAIREIKRIFDIDDNRLQFIFVDGDHSYTGVCKDIENYYPLLSPGGYMIFHDYLPELNKLNREAILSQHGGQTPGIRQACRELMEEKYGCKNMEIPLLYPDDPTQTQAHLPIIPGVFSTLRIYKKVLANHQPHTI